MSNSCRFVTSSAGSSNIDCLRGLGRRGLLIVANAIIDIVEEFEWFYLNYRIHCSIHCLEKFREEGEMRDSGLGKGCYDKSE